LTVILIDLFLSRSVACLACKALRFFAELLRGQLQKVVIATSNEGKPYRHSQPDIKSCIVNEITGRSDVDLPQVRPTMRELISMKRTVERPKGAPRLVS